MQPFTVKIFSGNFCRQSELDRCNPIENYTLRMIARQGCNYDDPYTPDCVAREESRALQICHLSRIQIYICFIFSDPKYISTSPTMANPSNGNSSPSVALSIPPTDPNTTNSPTMNLII